MVSRSSSARHLVTTHTSDDEEEVAHTQEEETGGTEAQQLDLAEYNFGENNDTDCDVYILSSTQSTRRSSPWPTTMRGTASAAGRMTTRTCS